MIYSTDLTNGLPIFKAFSSPIRISIFELIVKEPGISVTGISKKLHIPPSTLTSHMQMLKEAELITILDCPNTSHKICYVPDGHSQLMINMNFKGKQDPLNYRATIPVGCYNDFQITPPCGLASDTRFLGQLDEPRYFSQLTHSQAGIVWFATGYLEYALPNYIPLRSRITRLSFSFEIASEAPMHNNDYPSDIDFFFNGTYIGTYLSPGDFGDRPGKLNPSWWLLVLNQYGLRKKLEINSKGTFIDGVRLSDVSVQDLDLSVINPWKLRFSVNPDSPHPGGCTLFGRTFGDHAQDILFEIEYIDPACF